MLVFFFLFFIFIDLIATRYQIPYDWISAMFVVWNFGITGLAALFMMGQAYFKQGYLVILSVVVTWGLRKIPEWTTWALLLGVAIYDIFFRCGARTGCSKCYRVTAENSGMDKNGAATRGGVVATFVRSYAQ